MILIVDDVQTDRELLGKVVQAAGHSVSYANDGDEAVERAKAVKPTLIFMDVVMGRMNGFNATRKLKQDPDTANVPVVLVTSKSAESDKFWGQKQGADDHIAKPYTTEAIQNVLRRFAR